MRLGIQTYNAQSPAVVQLGAAVDKLNVELARTRSDLENATGNLAGKERNLGVLQQAADDANNNVKLYQKQIEEIQSAFNSQSASATETIKKLNDAIAATGADRDGAVKAGQEALNDYMQKAEEDRRKLVLQLEDAQSQIARLTAEIRDLRLRILNQGGKTDVAVGEPDGRVVRVNGATGEVYINLGKKDRMSPGLPFTAYDPRTGVRFGTDESAEGNGSLEVIEVGEDTSLCRITRTTKDRAIQANDLISNIVYHNDRTRKFRFTVFGDFDLDGDGVATAAERDRLIVLINSWGGQVDDDVTFADGLPGAGGKAQVSDRGRGEHRSRGHGQRAGHGAGHRDVGHRGERGRSPHQGPGAVRRAGNRGQAAGDSGAQCQPVPQHGGLLQHDGGAVLSGQWPVGRFKMETGRRHGATPFFQVVGCPAGSHEVACDFSCRACGDLLVGHDAGA